MTSDWTPIIFFIVIQVIATAGLLYNTETWSWLFWSCYHISLLYAIAFYYRRPQIIFGALHLGLMVQVTWVLDLIARFFNLDLFNLTTYIFQPGPVSIKFVAILTHFAVLFAILYWTYKIRPESISLAYTAIYIVMLYALTLILTPSDQNVNCIFHTCASYMPTWYYTQLWPFYVFAMALTTFKVHEGIYEYYIKD